MCKCIIIYYTPIFILLSLYNIMKQTNNLKLDKNVFKKITINV